MNLLNQRINDMENTDGFLKEIKIVFMEPCIAEPEKIRFIAELSDDVTEVMPYLNSVLKNAIYNKNIPAISLKKEFRLITIKPRKMTVAKALHSTDAYMLVDWIKDLINQTYRNRDNIEPSYELKNPPKPLDIYSWLPRTNCKQCGEPSCLAFAAKLFMDEQKIENCKPLYMKENEKLRKALEEIAENFGYSI